MTSDTPGLPVAHALASGAVAATLSSLVLVQRGARDTGHASAPLNAVSHWLWPRRALRANKPSLRHTASGTLIHYGSSLLWSSVYAWLRSRRSHPTVANALVDATAVTSLAACVDLVVVPQRLSPGFERRLAPASVAQVYAGFAVGLAVTALFTRTGR